MQIYHKINPNSLRRDVLGGLYKKFFIENVGKFSDCFVEFVGAIWSCSYDSFVDFVGGVILRTWVTQVILLRTLLALFLYAQASSILRWWAIVSGKASSKPCALLWFLPLSFSNLLHMTGWGLRPRLGIWALSLLGVVLPLDVGPLFVFLPFPSRLVLFLDWTCFIF